MSGTGGSSPDRLDDLLFRCLDQDEDGWSAALESLCEEYPGDADALRSRFTRLAEIGFTANASASAPTGEYGDFGDYELLRELGAGGMGVVYLAHQKSMNRNVALKLIRRDQLRSSRALARFRREITLASRLEHPGICTVYAAGEHEGVPYIAMRYIEGEGLLSHIAKLPSAGSGSRGHRHAANRVQAAVGIMGKVALAVQAAHEAGLVHRDIKPGNIMIDDNGEPVILDFGLAHDEDTTEVTLTLSGDRVGTPAYMAPEQVEGRRESIGRTTDVYGLGATLYECLTGRCPFQAPTHDALFHAILSSDAPDPRRLNPSISKDLKVVVETALEKEPRRRYPSASALAEDLRRIRCFEPIRAQRPGPLLRAKRWCQRHPQAAMTMLSLGIGLVVALFLLIQLKRSLADTRVENMLHRSSLALEVDGRVALELALDAFDLQPTNPGTLSQLHQALSGFRERTVFRGHAGTIWRMDLCEERGLLATAGFDGSIKLWRLDGTLLHTIVRSRDAAAEGIDFHYSVRFSRGGNHVLPGSGTTGSEGAACLWDVRAKPRLVLTLPHADCVVSAIFDGDENRILTTAMDGTFSLWDRDGKAVWTRNLRKREQAYFLEAVISPAGDKFLLRDLDPYDRTLISAELWTLSGQRLEAFTKRHVRAARFSPDGKRLVTGHASGRVRLWEVLESGVQTVAMLDRHTCSIQAVAIAGDGWILTAGKDRKVLLWTPDGRFEREIGRHASVIRSVRFSPDGGMVAAQTGRGRVRVFDRAGRGIAVLAGHREAVNTLLFSADGNHIFTCSFDGSARKWIVQEPALPVFHGHRAGVNSLDRLWLAGKGELQLLSGGDDRAAILWSGSGRLLRRHSLASEVKCARFSPSGNELLTADAGGAMRLFDRVRGDELWARRPVSANLQWLEFLPGRRIIAGYRWYHTYPLVWQWGRAGADLTCALGAEEEVWPNESLPFIHLRPESELLYLTEVGRGDILRFGLAEERPVRVKGPDRRGIENAARGFAIWSAAVSPDGTTVALGNRKGELLILARHGKVFRIGAHHETIRSLTFSPDSTRILSTSADGTAQLRSRNGNLILTFRGHGGAVNAGVFAPDGRRVFTASSDGTIRAWLVSPQEIQDLAHAWLAAVR